MGPKPPQYPFKNAYHEPEPSQTDQHDNKGYIDSGPGGRRFKSSRPDSLIQIDTARSGMPPERAIDVFVDVISSTIISFQYLSTIRVSTRRRSSIFGGLPSAKESQGKTAIAIATSALARNYHSLLTNSDRLADGCQGDLARATHCAKFPAHRGLNRNLFISLLTRLRRG